jgi:hypothetical protein
MSGRHHGKGPTKLVLKAYDLDTLSVVLQEYAVLRAKDADEALSRHRRGLARLLDNWAERAAALRGKVEGWE